MHICILDDAYEESTSELADVDSPSAPKLYFGHHSYEQHFLNKRTAIQHVCELAQRGFDVFVNLCDGAWDEDRAGVEVVEALERLNLPFTGAASDFYEPSREKMKLAGHYYDVPMPAGVFAATDADINRAADTLRFPLITKHPSSYSSIGMTKDSRVENADDLRREAHRMMERFGSVLIEEFIEGREFTVLVAENPDDPQSPIAYEPVEFVFPEGESFKHFDLKWLEYMDMTCVGLSDAGLARALKDMSSRFFLGLNGSGYGRCDIRMASDGALYMLEINPNCGIFYPPEAKGSADYALANDPRGHRHFVDTILESAHNRVRPPEKWKVVAQGGSGYGMVARRKLQEGELIVEYEEQPHVLVSRSHVESVWKDRESRWFERYAYPLTDEVYVMWSDDPDDWKPINHSCDPNAWLDGLNVTARREIGEGEEITMDYATFCAEPMPEFECTCDAADCRGTITGTDHLKPFVSRYGDHVSDYVRRKREALLKS